MMTPPPKPTKRDIERAMALMFCRRECQEGADCDCRAIAADRALTRREALEQVEQEIEKMALKRRCSLGPQGHYAAILSAIRALNTKESQDA